MRTQGDEISVFGTLREGTDRFAAVLDQGLDELAIPRDGCGRVPEAEQLYSESSRSRRKTPATGLAA